MGWHIRSLAGWVTDWLDDGRQDHNSQSIQSKCDTLLDVTECDFTLKPTKEANLSIDTYRRPAVITPLSYFSELIRSNQCFLI